jgi:hypothetical protein
MEPNKQYGICGSFVKIIGCNQILKAPHNHEEIKVWPLCNIKYQHPTIFIKRKLLKQMNWSLTIRKGMQLIMIYWSSQCINLQLQIFNRFYWNIVNIRSSY